MAKEKKIQENTFVGGVKSDPSNELLELSVARFLINCRLFEPGSKGKVKNVFGNTEVPNTYLPVGNNMCLGWGANEERSKFYWFNWNENAFHGVYCYDDSSKTVTPVIQNLIDTNNVDIFGFDPNFLINHIDIIQDTLIYWVDGLNKGRKFNISKAIDKTTSGYGTIIQQDFITAYKQTSIFAPQPVYFTDVTRSSNYLYGQQFKFSQRFYYDDNEISNTSDFSIVPLPPNESYLGADNITYNNNGINVQVSTGNRLVVKIEVLVQMTNGEVTLPWQSAVVLNKSQLTISDNTNFVYAFYNDTPLTAVDNNKVVRPYSFMQRVPYVQSFVRLAMTYGNAFEGFPTVNISASVVVTSQNLFLPDDTVSQLNSPAFTVTQTSVTEKSAGFLAGSYQVNVTHFIIGHDVKAGNKFILTGKNGAQDNFYWAYVATVSDNANTIASRVKTWLRSTGRGVPNADNGVDNQSIDGSGNVSWDYSYLGHYNTGPTVWAGNVNPVNFTTLLDNGLSINVIKSGGARKYAIVYEDDDGRKSLAYTCDALLAKTPFLTQWGTAVLQQPIHTIYITSQPPQWARYWQLVRTKDITDFTQMLIQNVVDVMVANEGDYLDLIVGSLNTYQLIHPNTVITYEFLKGDRLRLIKNDSVQPGVLYTPYFETEVLFFKDVVTQLIDAQIICTNGSANVTPGNGPNADKVGMVIVINGIQRTIESISGGDYVLDEPFNPVQVYTTNAQLTSTFPNYTLIDTRGTIRINKPPAGFNVVPFSTVEIYHPAVSSNNEPGTDQAQNFQDFSMKFEVANYGTPQAAHRGNLQDQDGSNPVTTPAVIQVTQGDCYIRQRALPTHSPQNAQDAQVIVDSVEDPNFSDFYVSNLYSLGRLFPQDDGRGAQLFNQRERFSNNYIQGTAVNGLNDFDAQDYKDYNDNYGSIMLSRYRKGDLFMFKLLKITWTPIDKNFIVDNQGNAQLATSDALLNEPQYSVWEGGIGARGAWFEFGDYQYISSDNSGVFLRGAQNGWEPISSKFFYDKVAREFLSVASHNNLQITGQYDKLNDEVVFSYLPYIQYLFNGGFNPAQWNTALAAYPVGTTWAITQQPANSSVAIVGGQINITGTNTLGDDYLLFQGTLPASGGTTPIIKLCFTVVTAPYRPIGYTPDNSTLYCSHDINGSNTGQQAWQILDQIFTDNGAVTGLKEPNITNISPEAIVPLAATITFNAYAVVAPSGGSNGDIWYNLPNDTLYKKLSGVWTLLTDRVINTNYLSSVLNIGACPIPPPANFFRVEAKYGAIIDSVVNGTCTGIPPALTGINISPPTTLNVDYSANPITAGTVNVVCDGMPAIPGHVNINMYINGVSLGAQAFIGPHTYTFTIPSTTTSPTPILITFETHA